MSFRSCGRCRNWELNRRDKIDVTFLRVRFADLVPVNCAFLRHKTACTLMREVHTALKQDSAHRCNRDKSIELVGGSECSWRQTPATQKTRCQ
jgi:hypothetical protein